MSITLKMPRLSDTMEQGTIIKWNIKEGDEVASGAVVADVETDKATMEMQVYDDGVVARILVGEGDQVPVGTAIALIAEEGEDPANMGDVSGGTEAAPAAEAPAKEPAAPSVPTTSSKPDSPATPAGDGRRIKVSPVARRLAEEHRVDLASVAGSGPGGRIIKRDILEVVERTASAGMVGEAVAVPLPNVEPGAITIPAVQEVPALQSTEVEVSGMRQTIARRLVESKQTIPHYQVKMCFAMDAILELRASLNEKLAAEGVKLSVNDFIVRACALAMAEHPMFNASWAGDRILVHQRVNVGVAVSLSEERGGGLVVATIRDANLKSLRMISAETKALAGKARDRGLSTEEMSDATFTISNLGMFGVDDFTAIINPPNSAILACGAAIEKPVVRDHQLAVGWEMAANLSLDHRVIDGAMAARYLSTLKSMIEEPMRLLA
ncbi:MAG: pyruvate dehydrogenase complex dihydrolipoamide acetyltransferase [Planctomycetaceae bacterium]|nr:pyruvate dehydrogenase complex dihydrolipoamide acetyltransferase [Planctomycetaceae bacterium]